MHPPEYKPCSSCGESKSLADFHADRRSPDGRAYHCKACISERGRRWRESNRERKRANNRAWALANPDKAAASQEKYRRANPEIYRKASAKWWAADPGRARAFARARYAANPERHREIGRRNTNNRRVGGLGNPLVVLENHDGVCGICGADVDSLSYVVDHIIPLSRGGANSYANTQPAHAACNARKWCKTSDADVARGEFRTLVSLEDSKCP